jgi:hypothetical protein
MYDVYVLMSCGFNLLAFLVFTHPSNIQCRDIDENDEKDGLGRRESWPVTFSYLQLGLSVSQSCYSLRIFVVVLMTVRLIFFEWQKGKNKAAAASMQQRCDLMLVPSSSTIPVRSISLLCL